MVDYWKDLINYKKKPHRYFRAEVDSGGEVDGDIVEVNFVEERDRIREQIQEDIRTYLPHADDCALDGLCQIVVDNFKGFE